MNFNSLNKTKLSARLELLDFLDASIIYSLTFSLFSTLRRLLVELVVTFILVDIFFLAFILLIELVARSLSNLGFLIDTTNTSTLRFELLDFLESFFLY